MPIMLLVSEVHFKIYENVNGKTRHLSQVLFLDRSNEHDVNTNIVGWFQIIVVDV